LLKLEYFTIADEKTLKTIEIKESDKKYRAFIAVFAGEIRLIDNIPLR
jgi:pantoate--beta-alanine ligase